MQIIRRYLSVGYCALFIIFNKINWLMSFKPDHLGSLGNFAPHRAQNLSLDPTGCPQS